MSRGCRRQAREQVESGRKAVEARRVKSLEETGESERRAGDAEDKQRKQVLSRRKSSRGSQNEEFGRSRRVGKTSR